MNKGYKYLFSYGTRITLFCKECKQKFETYPCRKNKKFCSRKCQGAWNSKNNKLDNNPNWKGGVKIFKKGKYIRIKKPNHPYADQTGYVFEHRLIMEQHIGRYLTEQEIIHHIDGNGMNNKIENLQIMCKKGEFSHAKTHYNARSFNELMQFQSISR